MPMGMFIGMDIALLLLIGIPLLLFIGIGMLGLPLGGMDMLLFGATLPMLP